MFCAEYGIMQYYNFVSKLHQEENKVLFLSKN